MDKDNNLEANIKETDKEDNNKVKHKFNENDDMILLLKRKIEKKSSVKQESKFRNNYKNYQYDYEEDFYEPRY